LTRYPLIGTPKTYFRAESISDKSRSDEPSSHGQTQTEEADQRRGEEPRINRAVKKQAIKAVNKQ
jgi:hypothetical protein